MEFDHLAVVTHDLAEGRQRLETLLGIAAWTAAIDDPVNGVAVQFGRDASGMVYELLAPLGDASPVAAALASNSAILNHVAYLVPDLAVAADRLRGQRCMPTGPARPAIAYGGAPIQFFLTPLHFLIELIEAPGHRHAFASGRP